MSFGPGPGEALRVAGKNLAPKASPSQEHLQNQEERGIESFSIDLTDKWGGAIPLQTPKIKYFSQSNSCIRVFHSSPFKPTPSRQGF